MKLVGLSFLALLLMGGLVFAQKGSSSGVAPNGSAAAASTSSIPPPPAITAETTPPELARAALGALGGDKFKNLKNIWIVGSVDLYAPNSTLPQPGKFSIVTAGPKIRMDVESPAFKFKQI